MVRKLDLLIVIGIIVSISIILGTRFETISEQTGKVADQNALILENQELIKTAINQSTVNTIEIRNTQTAILKLNENLLTVYMKLLPFSERIENSTDSNSNITIHSTEPS